MHTNKDVFGYILFVKIRFWRPLAHGGHVRALHFVDYMVYNPLVQEQDDLSPMSIAVQMYLGT